MFENNNTLEEINKKLDKIIAKQDEHDRIFLAIHGILKEILANLTAEQGGDLADALRKLAEAVNDNGTKIAASPAQIAQLLGPLIVLTNNKNNGS